jgi:hypothetical protein
MNKLVVDCKAKADVMCFLFISQRNKLDLLCNAMQQHICHLFVAQRNEVLLFCIVNAKAHVMIFPFNTQIDFTVVVVFLLQI